MKNYKHPTKYKGVRNQDIARLIVEENCLKCSEFMGQEHDFSECDLTGKKCPKPFKHPSALYSKDMVKLNVVESNGRLYGFTNTKFMVQDAPTIIEADKESEI